MTAAHAGATSNHARRVVVTGIGMVTAVGIGREQTWSALLAGTNGIRPVTLCDPTDLDSTIAHMTTNGVNFPKTATEGEGFRYVMTEAPDGILLELFETLDASMPPAAAPWFAWPH